MIKFPREIKYFIFIQRRIELSNNIEYFPSFHFPQMHYLCIHMYTYVLKRRYVLSQIALLSHILVFIRKFFLDR